MIQITGGFFLPPSPASLEQPALRYQVGDANQGWRGGGGARTRPYPARDQPEREARRARRRPPRRGRAADQPVPPGGGAGHRLAPAHRSSGPAHLPAAPGGCRCRPADPSVDCGGGAGRRPGRDRGREGEGGPAATAIGLGLPDGPAGPSSDPGWRVRLRSGNGMSGSSAFHAAFTRSSALLTRWMASCTRSTMITAWGIDQPTARASQRG
jgi:hypothetical protein